MASVDSEAISNFEVGYRRAAMDFNSSEYLWFSDYNNNSYQSGILKFDTLTAKDQFWIPADSYLMIPLAISAVAGAAQPYLSGDPIAFKNSVLSLITGIQILSGSGQTLVNDQSVQYINTIRRLLDTSWEAQQTNMNELQLWKDTAYPNTTNSLSATLSQWLASTVGPPADIGIQAVTNQQNPWLGAGGPPFTSAGFINPQYNEGFDMRTRLFKTNTQFGAATNAFTTNVFIPLRYIHPLFEKLDFPVINTRFQINFYTPINNTTAAVTLNTPLLHGPSTSNNAGAAVPMPDAQIQITSQTYIYYRKVTYTPEQTARVGAMIASGHKIVLEYPSMDFYPSIGLNLPPGSSPTHLVSPSTVAPLRVWELLLPVGYVAGSLANMQQQPFQTNAVLTRGNVLINSQRYYDNDLGNNGGLTYLHDFWEVFDEQTVGHGFKENLGSLIGFMDFSTYYNFNVYDVSRLKDRLPNPSEAVNIQIQSTSSAANGGVINNSDFIYIVERNTVAEMVFSNGQVSIAIGSQSS